MKSLKTILFVLLAGICLSSYAGNKKTSKKKGASIEVTDTFSYAYGKANTQGLKQYLAQRMGIDTTYIEDFLKGFQVVEMSEKDKRTKARMAGMEIRAQLENQIYPGASKELTDASADSLDKALFVQGFYDGVKGDENIITASDAGQMVQTKLEALHKADMEKKYGSNREAGKVFLQKNAQAEGVKTTPSGLQYKVIQQGSGEKPLANQKVKVNYEAKLIDGTVFDSSYKRGEPAIFVCNQVIKGWQEALTMMPVGSKWEIYIPQELGYGEHDKGKIPPFSTLIFTVELLEIEK